MALDHNPAFRANCLRPDEAHLFFSKRDKQNGLLRSQSIDGSVQMCQCDDAAPVIHRTTPTLRKIIVSVYESCFYTPTLSSSRQQQLRLSVSTLLPALWPG